MFFISSLIFLSVLSNLIENLMEKLIGEVIKKIAEFNLFLGIIIIVVVVILFLVIRYFQDKKNEKN